MISRFPRVMVGVLAAGLLSLPLLSTAVAAPAKKKKPAPAAKADPKAGKVAFKAEGCASCHKTKDYADAGEVGPDLSTIGKDHKAEQISAYIKKPKAGSIMPAFKGDAKTLANMTAYLVTQK